MQGFDAFDSSLRRASEAATGLTKQLDRFQHSADVADLMKGQNQALAAMRKMTAVTLPQWVPDREVRLFSDGIAKTLNLVPQTDAPMREAIESFHRLTQQSIVHLPDTSNEIINKLFGSDAASLAKQMARSSAAIATLLQQTLPAEIVPTPPELESWELDEKGVDSILAWIQAAAAAVKEPRSDVLRCRCCWVCWCLICSLGSKRCIIKREIKQPNCGTPNR